VDDGFVNGSLVVDGTGSLVDEVLVDGSLNTLNGSRDGSFLVKDGLAPSATSRNARDVVEKFRDDNKPWAKELNDLKIIK